MSGNRERHWGGGAVQKIYSVNISSDDRYDMTEVYKGTVYMAKIPSHILPFPPSPSLYLSASLSLSHSLFFSLTLSLSLCRSFFFLSPFLP